MDAYQEGKHLPEELVEQIIAMMPFPSLFKARVLSKSWQARFSPISSQPDEEKKRVATTFQRLVCEQSKKWGSFFPICIHKDVICAYHQASSEWVKLPPLSFIPIGRLEHLESRLWLEGALLFKYDIDTQNLCVANIFTRRWKELPAPPSIEPWRIGSLASVLDSSSETYKAVFVCDGYHIFSNSCAEMYNSKSDEWSSKTLMIPDLSFCSAHLDGILYMSTYSVHSLLAFNVEEGTLEEHHLSFSGQIGYTYMVNVLVCNGLLLIIAHEVLNSRTEIVHVLKVDLMSRELLKVGRGDVSAVLNGDFRIDAKRNPTSVGTRIFFPLLKRQGGQMVAYDVQANEWSYVDYHSTFDATFNPVTGFDWFNCSFQPGCNPFAEV